jgi:hypothetical protein
MTIRLHTNLLRLQISIGSRSKAWSKIPYLQIDTRASAQSQDDWLGSCCIAPLGGMSTKSSSLRWPQSDPRDFLPITLKIFASCTPSSSLLSLPSYPSFSPIPSLMISSLARVSPLLTASQNPSFATPALRATIAAKAQSLPVRLILLLANFCMYTLEPCLTIPGTTCSDKACNGKFAICCQTNLLQTDILNPGYNLMGKFTVACASGTSDCAYTLNDQVGFVQINR